jgi:hypothetical protein
MLRVNNVFDVLIATGVTGWALVAVAEWRIYCHMP